MQSLPVSAKHSRITLKTSQLNIRRRFGVNWIIRYRYRFINMLKDRVHWQLRTVRKFEVKYLNQKIEVDPTTALKMNIEVTFIIKLVYHSWDSLN